MKKIVLVLSMLLVVSVLALGFGCAKPAEAPAPAPAPAQPTKVFKWRLAGATPPTDIGYEGVVEWCKSVEKRSHGRLVITPYPADQLFKVKDNFDSTKKGIVEMMYSAGSYWSGIMPECNWETGLPYTTTFREEEIALMYEEGLLDILREAYAEHNMYYMTPTPTGQRGFTGNRAIRTAADYKGLKARCTGPEADLLKELGGSPVFLTGGEIYTALDLGTIDAASWTMMAWEHMHWNEVCKYYNLPRTANMIVALVINMDAWNSLPEDLQQIMEWCGKDWIFYCATRYHEVESRQESLMGPETKIVLPPSEQAIVQQAAYKVWDKIAAMSPRNEKAVAIIKNYLARIGKIK